MRHSSLLISPAASCTSERVTCNFMAHRSRSAASIARTSCSVHSGPSPSLQPIPNGLLLSLTYFPALAAEAGGLTVAGQS